MKLPENYMERVYSGWLGKVIGIRLGAAGGGLVLRAHPERVWELWEYPAQYKNFAADDDSNGPMFFIRSLRTASDLRSFSAQDVADALLNYAPMSTDFLVGRLWRVHRTHGLSEPAQRHSRAPQRQCGANGSTMAEQTAGKSSSTPGAWYPRQPRAGGPLKAEKKPPASPTAATACGAASYVACAISLAFVEPNLRLSWKGLALHPPRL